MNDLYDLINIKKIDKEEEIKNAIKEVKTSLEKLDTERTCMIYSSYIKESLSKKNIVARIIDTKDLGIDYSHHFCMVPKNKNEYYLIDLTFNQFGQHYLFDDLYEKGYMLIDNNILAEYLEIFNNKKYDITMDEVYNSNIKR